MARVKRGVAGHARHKKIVDMAKGYAGKGDLVGPPAPGAPVSGQPIPPGPGAGGAN